MKDPHELTGEELNLAILTRLHDDWQPYPATPLPLMHFHVTFGDCLFFYRLIAHDPDCKVELRHWSRSPIEVAWTIATDWGETAGRTPEEASQRLLLTVLNNTCPECKDRHGPDSHERTCSKFKEEG